MPASEHSRTAVRRATNRPARPEPSSPRPRILARNATPLRTAGPVVEHRAPGPHPLGPTHAATSGCRASIAPARGDHLDPPLRVPRFEQLRRPVAAASAGIRAPRPRCVRSPSDDLELSLRARTRGLRRMVVAPPTRRDRYAAGSVRMRPLVAPRECATARQSQIRRPLIPPTANMTTISSLSSFDTGGAGPGIGFSCRVRHESPPRAGVEKLVERLRRSEAGDRRFVGRET
jgi:hypothetical protein